MDHVLDNYEQAWNIVDNNVFESNTFNSQGECMCKITSNESKCRIPRKLEKHQVYFEGHLGSGSICGILLTALSLCDIKDAVQLKIDNNNLNSKNRNTDKRERKCENITRDRHDRYWNVAFRINGKRVYIGKRIDFNEAVILKMSAERHFFGEIKTHFEGLEESNIPEYQDTSDFRFGEGFEIKQTKEIAKALYDSL